MKPLFTLRCDVQSAAPASVFVVLVGRDKFIRFSAFPSASTASHLFEDLLMFLLRPCLALLCSVVTHLWIISIPLTEPATPVLQDTMRSAPEARGSPSPCLSCGDFYFILHVKVCPGC